MPFQRFAISRKMSLCFGCPVMLLFTSLKLSVTHSFMDYTLRLKHAYALIKRFGGFRLKFVAGNWIPLYSVEFTYSWLSWMLSIGYASHRTDTTTIIPIDISVWW